MASDSLTTPEFVLDEVSITKVIEAILTKMKEHGSVLSRAEDASVWDKIVSGVISGSVADGTDGTKAVPIELLAEIILKGQFLKYKLVTSDQPINEVVLVPEVGTIYLLKKSTTNKATVWMYMQSIDSSYYWLEVAAVELPELNYVDTESEDAISNIVTHIKNQNKDYSDSMNVKAGDIVTAQALTNVLIGLGYVRKTVVAYSKHGGKPISEYVPKPAQDVLYLYQETDDEEDWAAYIAVKNNGKVIWLKLSNDKPIEIDLSGYWSKEELQIISAEKVDEIFNNAVNKVFND